MSARAKRKVKRARARRRRLPVDPMVDFREIMQPAINAIASYLDVIGGLTSGAKEAGAGRIRPDRPTPTVQPLPSRPVTFAPALGVVPNRAQVAVVVCQAIRAAGLQPVRCNSCDSMHLDLVPARRHIHTDELTPSVLRACRLIPEDVLAAWEAAV